MEWVAIGPDGVAREATEAESTHVAVHLYRKALLDLAAAKRELEELQDKNRRLYAKHQQTRRQKERWRAEALKAQGVDPSQLHPKKVIIARDGEYWSLQVTEIEAPSEQEALGLALELVRANVCGRRVRLNRLQSLGNDEWLVEALVAVSPVWPELKSGLT